MMLMTMTKQIPKATIGAACLFVSMAIAAAESEPPDTSNWKCKWCLVNSATSTDFEGGLGYVSDDSFKFGQYSGLGDAGMFAIVNGESEHRGEDGRFWTLSAYLLGPDRISAGATAPNTRIVPRFD